MQEGQTQPWRALPPSQVTNNTVKDALGRGVEPECKCTVSTGYLKVLLRGSGVMHHENLWENFGYCYELV